MNPGGGGGYLSNFRITTLPHTRKAIAMVRDPTVISNAKRPTLLLATISIEL